MKPVIPENREIEQIAAHLDSIGDPTRLKILYALAEKEHGVQELASILSMSMPAVSHHLRLLRDKEIILRRKDGINVYYRLVDDCIRRVLDIARIHIEHDHIPREREKPR